MSALRVRVPCHLAIQCMVPPVLFGKNFPLHFARATTANPDPLISQQIVLLSSHLRTPFLHHSLQRLLRLFNSSVLTMLRNYGSQTLQDPRGFIDDSGFSQTFRDPGKAVDSPSDTLALLSSIGLTLTSRSQAIQVTAIKISKVCWVERR